jgi:hypothetical protein
MLQNRVDPFGNIIKTPARGAWMGNRGVLHDPHQILLRPFRLKAWITCQLEFKGRKRQVMAPDRWTELFFLDEATSFAAGHRPCFECRRIDANRFKAFWLKGNPEYNFDEKTPIGEIDKILHRERIDPSQTKLGGPQSKTDWPSSKITFEVRSDKIPTGTFIVWDNKPYLVKDHFMYLWSPFGYEEGIDLPAGEGSALPAAVGSALPASVSLTVLTPRSVVNAFRAGYVPQMAVG